MPIYVGDLLTATAAPVTGKPAPTRTWQWLRDSTAISGATSNIYNVTKDDLGLSLAVQQIETNIGGVATATSAATDVVEDVLDFTGLLTTLLSDATQLIAHPLEYDSMFQDRAGTTPVTAPGQLVGMVLDHGFTGSKPVPGPELFSDFAIEGEWVDNGDGSWTVTNATANTDMRIDGLTTTGKHYQYSFDITTTTNLIVYSSQPAPVSRPTGSYTFNNVSTSGFFIFRATAGTTATVSNISVRELPGYHATAISDAARGVYAVVPETGRRNLLTYTEDLTVNYSAIDAEMTPTSITATVQAGAQNPSVFYNVAVPTGTTTWFVDFSNLAGAQYVTLSSVLFDVNANGFSSFDLSVGTVASQGANHTASIENLGNGVFRCAITFTTDGTDDNGRLIIGISDLATLNRITDPNGTETVQVLRQQLELGSTATAYQKVVTEYEVTEAGVPSLPYLAYNGVNTAYATPALAAPLVDKAQVFAGVRKLSDAAAGNVLELSATVSNNGSILIRSPQTGGDYGFFSRGSVLSFSTVSVYAAPITNVLTGLGDISGDVANLRVDGVLTGTSTTDQGTGNYNPSGTYPLYYGARAGASLFFNGRSYATLGPITRFSAANATAAQIEAAEAYYTARVI